MLSVLAAILSPAGRVRDNFMFASTGATTIDSH